MSTAVVVRKGAYAAIGADTLYKLGYTKESAETVRSCSKILKIGDSFFACVGDASGGLVFQSYFSRLRRIPPLDSVQAIFEAARKMHKSLKEDYYLRPVEEKDDPFESSQIECLIANASGIFGLYSLRSVQEYSKFYAFGSGYRVALGAMHAAYAAASSAEEVARAGLEAAAEFDDGTGLPIEVHTLRLRDAARRPAREKRR